MAQNEIRDGFSKNFLITVKHKNKTSHMQKIRCIDSFKVYKKV